MSYWVVLAAFSGIVSFVTCNPVVPCNHADEKCLEKISSNLHSKVSLSKIISEDPELGTENLDPIHHDFIDGNLSILKYKLNDSYTTGLKDCNIENFKLNAGLVSLHFDLVCPKFSIKGKYEISGRLIVLPVEGKGDFVINTQKYRVRVDSELKVTSGKDGKQYISIKNFKQTSEPLESIEFDFKNLFNGQKDLADAVLKFANENWYEVAKEVQEPILTAHCKKIVKNMNKYFKKLSIDDLGA